jgi:hypothetical protein
VRATTHLDVYGLKIAVGGEWDEVVEAIRLDFAWFEQNDAQNVAVAVEIERRPPDFAVFGELVAAFVTPRNVVYQDNGRTVVDYFGRAVSVYDRTSGRLVVQGEDEHLVHEAAYHFLISSVGEHLERQGLSRLHALGLVGAQGGVAVLLPSGGGKSTLALRAIKSNGIKLLSEDTPLLDRHGRLHPFPLRIGVNATEAAELPAGKVRRLERMEFHPKFVLELDAFADRIQTTPVPLRHLVIGRRTLGRGARLERLPRRAAVGTLLRELVFGVGVYQGMEFVLQHGMRDIFGRLRPAVTRSRCCLGALASTDVWRLTVGRDHERNWEALQPLLAGEDDRSRNGSGLS